jgi:hypothetical protein
MSRVIKFRAWNGKSMVTDEKLVFWNGNTYLNESGTLNDPGQPHKPARLKGYTVLAVMQFTGVTDKNGKEIYEGDVLHCEDEMYASDKVFSSSDIFPVIFDGGAFRYDGITLADMVTGGHPRTCEVIGNVYENPDLLQK